MWKVWWISFKCECEEGYSPDGSISEHVENKETCDTSVRSSDRMMFLSVTTGRQKTHFSAQQLYTVTVFPDRAESCWADSLLTADSSLISLTGSYGSVPGWTHRRAVCLWHIHYNKLSSVKNKKGDLWDLPRFCYEKQKVNYIYLLKCCH